MSAATVITGGFGSFGDVAHIVTDGYDIASVAVIVPNEAGLEFTLPTNRLHYTLPDNLLGYTLPTNRMHYTIPGEP